MAYIIICLREVREKTVPIPIMADTDDGEAADHMATFETMQEATDFCAENILLQNSQNIVIDLETGESELF